MGAAQTRKLLKKLDQNFHTLVQFEYSAFMNKKADFRLRKSTTTIHYSLFTLHLKIGVRGRKAFFKKFSSPP